MSDVEIEVQVEAEAGGLTTVFVSVWADDAAVAARLGERMVETIEGADGWESARVVVC